MNVDATPIGEDDLQAFIDGRLSGERLAIMDAYLFQHPEINEQVTTDKQHRQALRARFDPIMHEPIPTRLRLVNIQAARRKVWGSRLRAASVAAGIFSAGSCGGWIGATLTPHAPRELSETRTTTITRDAVRAHETFAVEVSHPVEVDAANEKHLLQWLSKRLGRRLTAPNLAQFGYALTGGRLLPSKSGAAAQLMYDNAGGKRLTLYVQSADGPATAFRFQHGNDASTFAWIDQGFGFALTASAERNVLLPIAQAVYRSFEDAIEADSR